MYPRVPITAIIFTIIFGVVSALNLLWLIRVVKKKVNLNYVDIEKQNLVSSTLPEGVVASNINVSAKSRPSLLGELRQDENLAWAHESISPMRNGLVGILGLSLFFNFGGFITALTFSIIFDGIDVLFLSMWIPLLCISGMLLFISYVYYRSYSNSIIYAVTSKRVFIFSSMHSGCFSGKTETVRAYDLDGIHQTTLTRKDDGTGTLTFSATSLMEGAYDNSGRIGAHGLGFAFVDVPNVTAVKDLIEQYKTLRKKQAGNQ